MIKYACIVPHPPVIVPEIGGLRTQDTALTISSLERICRRLQAIAPQTAVLISPHGPNHPSRFRLASGSRLYGSFNRWGAPGIDLTFSCDLELLNTILQEAPVAKINVEGVTSWSEQLDWGCTVPLYHLRAGLERAKLLICSVTALDVISHYNFGQFLTQCIQKQGREIVVICSADLSHCLIPGAPSGYDPAGKIFDTEYQKAINTWDFAWIRSQTPAQRRQAAEDAIPQTAILMGMLSGSNVSPHILSYEAPFGVGYMVAEIKIA